MNFEEDEEEKDVSEKLNFSCNYSKQFNLTDDEKINLDNKDQIKVY